MKIKWGRVLALGLVALVLSASTYALGATSGKAAKVRLVSQTSDLHVNAGDGLVQVPGTALRVKAGHVTFNYQFYVAGSPRAFPSVIWDRSGDFYYAWMRINCTDGSDYYSVEVGGSGVPGVGSGYCTVSGSASFAAPVTLSLGVATNGSAYVVNTDGTVVDRA